MAVAALVYVLVVLCTALYDCDATTTNNDFDSPACQNSMWCSYGDGVGDILRAAADFRMDGLVGGLNLLCTPGPYYPYPCFNDTCQDESMRKAARFADTMFSWLCRHREQFRGDESCYQGVFTEKMSGCKEMDVSGPLISPRSGTDFRYCLFSMLEYIPNCSRDSFFVTYIDFLINERRSQYGF